MTENSEVIVASVREAVVNNDLKILHKLLQETPYVETYDEKTDSELITACRLGHHNAALLLMNFGANVNYQNEKGWTALMLANDKGQVYCIQALMDKQADLNLQCKKGSTAIMHSAYRGYYDCVKLMLEGGADITLTDDDGHNAAYYSSRHPEVKTLLENHAT